MTKTETVKQLPSAAPSAVIQMQHLEATITHLDESLAIALNRIETQQDVMAADLLPVVELRDQIIHALTQVFKTLQTTTADAKATQKAMSDTLNALREQARLLESAYQNSRPAVWKSGLAAGLFSGVLVSVLLSWSAPDPTSQLPSVTIDTQALSTQIIEKWTQLQQQRQINNR